MNANILCIDDSEVRARDRQRILGASGFVVTNAHDETQAIELLSSHRIDAICVDSRSNAGIARLGAVVRRLRPHVRVILICGDGAVPARFQEHVDIVMDESDFNRRARHVIDGLRDFRCPFFVEWLNDWKRRAAPSIAAPSRFASMALRSDVARS
jgi:CheY-like chemotaxis protein